MTATDHGSELAQREQRLTERVTRSFDGASSPRTRELLQSLVSNIRTGAQRAAHR